jgi:uncharacterized protein involved in exopolysaccharide biosynthesis
LQTAWRYGAIIWRWKWIVVPLVVIPVVVAGLLSKQQQKQYRGTAQVLIQNQNLAAALTNIPDTSGDSGDQLRLMETQASIARSISVARLVVENSDEANLTPQDVLGASTVTADRNADILAFGYTDPDPTRAVDLSNAYARAFTRYRRDLDTRAIKTASREVDQRLKELAKAGDKDSRLRGTLQDKRDQLDTLAVLQTANAAVVNPAQSAVKTAPKVKRNVMLGGLLGLVLAYLVAFVLETARPRKAPVMLEEEPEVAESRELV